MKKIKLKEITESVKSFIWLLNTESNLEKKNWYSIWIFLFAIIWLYLTYLQLWKVSMISDNLTAYNPQKIDTTKLTATWLVTTYFQLLRNQDYEKSCWLETLWQCRYENPWEFLKYQEEKKKYWYTKLVNWEELVNIWQYDWAKKDNIEYVCLRTKYEYSGENIPIEELWEYKVLTRPTGEKEIAYKQCVWKWKGGKMTDGKSCPVLNTKCADSEPK